MKTILLSVVFTILLMVPCQSFAGEPTDAIRSTVDSVMQILKDKELKGDGRKAERREKMRKAVDERFDFHEMARRSLAAHWEERTPAEKDEFVSLYADLLERTYIKKIESYEDEEVQYLGEKIQGIYSLVKTQLVDDKGLEVPISYKLHSRTGKWEVYDVIIEGVSLINNYRTQFRSELRSGSYEELIKKLKDKIEKEN